MRLWKFWIGYHHKILDRSPVTITIILAMIAAGVGGFLLFVVGGGMVDG
jgi:hypothetical protein